MPIVPSMSMQGHLAFTGISQLAVSACDCGGLVQDCLVAAPPTRSNFVWRATPAGQHLQREKLAKGIMPLPRKLGRNVKAPTKALHLTPPK